MKKHTLSLLGLVLSLGAATAFAAPRPVGTEVLVAADAYRGPDGLRPTPGKPIYYILTQVSQSIGEPIAGVKLPDASAIERSVVDELTKQGFVRTQVGGPMPTLFIIATWGASNFSSTLDDPDLQMYRDMVPASATRHIADEPVRAVSYMRSDDGAIVEDSRQNQAVESMALYYRYMASPRSRDQYKAEVLAGTQKMLAANLYGTANGQKVAAASNEDRLFISLAAFDAQEYAKKNKQLLWRTSMSVGWKNDYVSTLPVMLASGGPFFGSDIKEPAFMDDRERRNFEVRVGDPTVVPVARPKS